MLTDPIMYPQNNWLDIMYNNAFIMEHNMRFSGGDDKIYVFRIFRLWRSKMEYCVVRTPIKYTFSREYDCSGK